MLIDVTVILFPHIVLSIFVDFVPPIPMYPRVYAEAMSAVKGRKDDDSNATSIKQKSRLVRRVCLLRIATHHPHKESHPLHFV